jgi:lipopolysaccharide export LptBFGC system permease protein LptF
MRNAVILLVLAGIAGLTWYFLQPTRFYLLIDYGALVADPDMANAQHLGRGKHELRIGQRVRAVEIVFHNKLAVPAACAIFAVFAPVVAFYFSRGGAFVGVLISIFIVFLYYNLWILTSQVLAKGWILPPVLGAWLPNILFAIAGVVALWRAD